MTQDLDIRDLIDSRSQRKEKAPIFGTVSKVFDKQSNDIEEGNIEVNVLSRGLNHEFRRVPVINTDHSGHAYCPKKGDQVMLDWKMGDGYEPICVGASYTNKDSHRAPNMRAGHWRHQFNGDQLPGSDEHLHFEAVPKFEPQPLPDNDYPRVLRMGTKLGALDDVKSEISVDIKDLEKTKIRIMTDGTFGASTTDGGDITIGTKKGEHGDGHIVIETEAGNIDLTTETGNINATAESGDVTATATDGDLNATAVNGQVNVSADNGIYLNTSDGSKNLAYADHTHDYDDTGDTSDGDAGTSTKTTTKPNEDGTQSTFSG